MKQKKKAALAAALWLAVSANGQAAEAAQEETFALDEVVITASKTKQDVKDSPSAVQVITRKTMDEQGAQTLKDVLRYAVGVNLVRTSASPTREGISIRGFDSRFSMILVDGKRVASEIDQNYELDRISIVNIERIEIVRGPASSLYGTEAMGGVVNIITCKSDKPSVVLDVGSGFYSGGDSRDRYAFQYNSGQQGKVSFTFSGSLVENDAMFKSGALTYAPYGSRKNWNTGVDYKLSDKEKLSFTAGYAKEDTYEFVKPGAVRVKAHDIVEREDLALAYEKKTEKQDVFLRYYHSVMDKSLDQNNAATLGLVNWVRAKRTIDMYEGRVTQQANAKHRLTFGAEYRPETFRGTAVNTGEGYFTATGPGGATKTGSTANLTYRAAYVQDEWQVSNKLLAVTSLRYDDSNKFESNVSPKLGLTYKVNDTTRIKANAAQGFRSPTPNQLYQSASTQQGNPNLQSETSRSYDLSFEKEWHKKAAKVTFFTNDVSNLIDLVTTTGTNKQYQNISKAIIRGAEAEFTRMISPTLDWTNSYTYLEAVNGVTQQRLPNRARHMLTSGLTYHNNKDFTASFQGQLLESYLASPGGEKSYVLWNLAMSKKLSSQYTVVLGVDNLFNKQDEDLPLMGTYVHASLRCTF
ncbi:MAG: TonB-dependent receptor [Negativicutes bacterium]|nr:TonB-dependent receptor [Negativicutes bacterium]